MTLREARAEHWARTALAPPRAHGTPLSLAGFKATPEDFRVEEQLSFTPSGDGPHWLLRVEKKAANTRWVASQLARLAGVADHDVGYAGLKDRHAVAVQWFSVPVQSSTVDFWRSVSTAEFKVRSVERNSRKLKRGALTGNRFRVQLRDVRWTRAELNPKLMALCAHGVPNYFGPQRFGRDGRNLDRVADWIAGRAPSGRTERGFTLSAARALMFNALLARRVDAGDWAHLAPGDLASLDGSGSHFQVATVDDDLQRRVREFDLHPSGPLWGLGDPPTSGRAREHEAAVAEQFHEVAKLLASQGLAQERRALRCAVREVSVDVESDAVTLSFLLGRGQFATSVLREICELGFTPESEPDGE